MNIISPEIRLPKIELQYLKKNGEKLFRIISGIVDPLLLLQLNEGKIRMQFWLERELRKKCGYNVKRSWVHSRDNSNNAPAKLFTIEEYYYGGGGGWGFATGAGSAPYSTTNGYVPTEFEITSEDIINGRIIKEFSVMDIFSNIISRKGVFAITGDPLIELCIRGRKNSISQPLRIQLVANYNHTPVFGEPSNILNLGIHKCQEYFNENQIESFIRIGHHK